MGRMAGVIALLFAACGNVHTPVGGDGGGHCTEDAPCDDGLYCNGREQCDMGVCASGAAPCRAERCDEASDTCSPL